MIKRWQDWANYFLGLWVFGSPWLLEHSMVLGVPGGGSRAMWNLWVVGLAVVVISTVALNTFGGLGRVGEFWARRVVGGVAVGIGFRRLPHDPVDVEFGDFWCAYFCGRWLDPYRGAAAAAIRDIAGSDRRSSCDRSWSNLRRLGPVIRVVMPAVRHARHDQLCIVLLAHAR
jgi:hypothetical protein